MRFLPALAWYLVAVCGAVVIGAPGPVYWDSFGYVTQAITGYIGGLGVGRPVFAMATQVIATAWRWVGGSVWDLEVLLRVACLLVSACGAPLARRLALEVGLGARAAHLAAAFVAASPAFAHSSATVLTDGAATTFVLLSWVVALRAARSGRLTAAALAGLWFGVAIGLREASVFAGATILCIGWTVPRNRLVPLAVVFAAVVLVVVSVPMVWVYATQPGYADTIRNWLGGLEHDRAMKAWDWRELRLIVYWLLLLGPVALWLTARFVRHWRAAGVWKYTLVLPAWVQWAIMMTYMGIAYSPRYLMTAFPAAMALPAAWMLDRILGDRLSGRAWVALVAAFLVPLGVGRVISRASDSPLLAVSSSMPMALAAVPADAIVVTGHACPAVPMIRQLATVEPRGGLTKPRWTEVCPGWGWPDDLVATLEAYRAEGRVVVVDLRVEAWHGVEQQRTREEVRRYWQAYGGRQPGTVIAWGADQF
jgi:4-amino-4-deoxy-L-arabinose transferase-like glycosyltransferase